MKTIAQLINSGTSLINIKDNNCIGVFNKEELLNLKEASIWIINLHLNWDNNHLQNNYGLDMGVYIRKELKSKTPILFYSHLKEENFTKLIRATDFKYKLLQTPECHYIEAPIGQNQLEALITTTSPISDFCLEDINYYVFNAKGRIDELCHNLKNDLKEESNNKAVIEQFKNYCTNEIVSNNIDKLNKIIEKLKNDLKTNLNKGNTYFDVINKYKPQIITLLPTSDEDNNETINETTTENINWQVIYLEDDEQVATKVKFYFKENNVTCHIATNETEAKQKLDDNPNVTLFITDIRLKDKSGKWHKHQGYDVIEQIANHAKIPLVFAVLTSKKGSIINSAKQKLQHQIFWENKDNVLHSKQAFDIYFNRLKELADENFVSNYCFQPTYKSWHQSDGPNVKQVRRFKPLSEYYKDYKNQLSSDYKNSEIILNNYNYKDLKPKTDENKGESNTVSFNSSLTEKSSLIDFSNNILKPRRLLLYHIFKNSEFIAGLDKRNFFNKIGFSSETDKLVSNIISYYLLNPYGAIVNTEILYEEYIFLIENKLIQDYLQNYDSKKIDEIIDKHTSGEQNKSLKLNKACQELILKIFIQNKNKFLNCNIKKEYNNLVNNNIERNDFEYLKRIVNSHGIDKKTINNLKLSNQNNDLLSYIDSLS